MSNRQIVLDRLPAGDKLAPDHVALNVGERPTAGEGQVLLKTRYISLDAARRLLERALVWNGKGELVNITPRPALCFNPILGAVTGQTAPARLNLGAVNATGLEWGARPAFMARQVSARCEGGVLRVTRPKSGAFRQTGDWANRRKEPGFNLFYADVEADAKQRLAAWLAG